MKHIKKYKKGGQKFPDLTGDGKVTMADILKGRGVKKAGKGMKYENGGKFSKSKRPKKMEKMRTPDRVGTPGSKKTREELKKATKGSIGDIRLRYNTGKSAAQLLDATDKSNQVPNKALAKKTEDFGSTFGKKTYYEGNPGGLKGKTKGKGGNVGAGVKLKKKRRR